MYAGARMAAQRMTEIALTSGSSYRATQASAPAVASGSIVTLVSANVGQRILEHSDPRFFKVVAGVYDEKRWRS